MISSIKYVDIRSISFYIFSFFQVQMNNLIDSISFFFPANIFGIPISKIKCILKCDHFYLNLLFSSQCYIF